MAGEANGRPAELSQKLHRGANGQLAIRPTPVKRPSAVAAVAARAINWGTWLLVWYTIVTALFRCPPSLHDLTATSPKVCGPAIKARNYVTPYTQPYYEKYAATHVERARPYVHRAHEQLVEPVVEQARVYYDRYGAEKIEHVKEFGQEKWEKVLGPQVDTAQTEAKRQYDEKLAPHVDKASAAAAPYVTASRENVEEVYHKHILPTYGSVREGLVETYQYVQEFLGTTVLPQIKLAWDSTAVFITRTLWPRIRIVYGQNVEPQLVRIGQRLRRYRDGRKVQAVMDEADETPLSSSLSPTASSILSTTSSSTASASTSLTPQQEADEVRAKVESDLETWQNKFTKAADKGLEELRGRVKEITDRQIKSQAYGTGNALAVNLEETVKSEESKLKKTINKIVKGLPEEPSEPDLTLATDKLSNATRSAGQSIKVKAQALRDWKEDFDRETRDLAMAASTSTTEVIDSIRDLGLQEIGMKWAHIEGITYNDWSKYHEVKKSFDEWHNKLSAVVEEHPGLQASLAASEEVEAKGMAIAEDAAKELSRLKNVGKWKIQAHDSSNDFSTKAIPAAAAVGAQKVADKAAEMASSASESIVGTSQGTVESLASEASSAIIGTESGYAEQASSKVADAAESVSEKISSAVKGSSTPAAESIASAAKNKAENFASEASEAIIGTPQPAYESIASELSENLDGATSVVSDSISGASSVASSSASSAASQASKKVYGGAMAADVKEQKPILDDVVDEGSTYSEKMQSIVGEAGDKVADVTRAVSEAILGASKTQGTYESASSVADEQYSKALAAASSVLYGTPQGTAESVTSVASEKWADAVAAASSIIYGTPAPVTESAAQAASSAYADATQRAQQHYSNALSVVSAQISGKPKPVHEEMFSSVEKGYSDSLGAASSRLQDALNAASTAAYGNRQQQVMSAANAKYTEALAGASSQLESAKSAAGATSKPGYEKFMSDASSRYASLIGAASSQHASATKAASEAIYGPTQGVLESISAVASSRLQDSLNAASAQYESAKTAVGATPTPVHQQYLADAQQKYYAGIGLAHVRYSEFVSAASSAVYGTPTPVHESLASAASEQIYGTPKPAYQAMLDSAQVKYNEALEVAASKKDSLLKDASSLAGKSKKSGPQSLTDAANSQYSSAVSAASESLSSLSSVASDKAYGTSIGKVESIASAASEQANSIASAASTAIVGSETPWSEAAASQASQNWEALVAKASEQVYGAPTPFHASAYSQAGDYAAQATSAAQSQYSAVAALFSELVSGREPDFTESVSAQLSSAFFTNPAASVAGNAYASVSSAVSGIFTPPATLESIIAAAQNEVNSAIEAASVGLYGSEKGTYEKATSAAADAASKASEKVYGTQPSYLEQAQESMSAIAASASDAIAAAIYGSTATGYTAQASSAAADAANTVKESAEQAVEKGREAVEQGRQKIKEAVYGPEKGAVDSAQAKLLEILEAAKARMGELGEEAGKVADKAQDAAGKAAGKVSGTGKKGKDEL